MQCANEGRRKEQERERRVKKKIYETFAVISPFLKSRYTSYAS